MSLHGIGDAPAAVLCNMVLVQVIPGAGDRAFGQKVEHGEVGQREKRAAFGNVFVNMSDLVVDFHCLQGSDQYASPGLLKRCIESFEERSVPEEGDQPVGQRNCARDPSKTPTDDTLLGAEQGEETLGDQWRGDENGLVDVDEVIEVSSGEDAQIDQSGRRRDTEKRRIDPLARCTSRYPREDEPDAEDQRRKPVEEYMKSLNELAGTQDRDRGRV